MADKLIVTLNVDELKSIIAETVSEVIQQSSPPKTEVDEILKRKDIIALLSISYVTLNEWMKSGRIPYHRINSRIFFKKSEVMKAMELSPKYRRNC